MTNWKLIDVQALRIFLATAEDCNMSNAASRLGITQSAVSQANRNLEEYFGVLLINRKRRPLTLTPAGLTLRNRGAVLIEAMLNLRGSVIEASEGIKPDLRMGMVDSFAATCGTDLIGKLVGKVVQLSIRSGWAPHLGEALVRRDLDLVITTDPLEDVNGIVRHRLLDERFLIITPKSAAITVRTMEDLGQMADALPIIRFNQQSHSGMQIDRILRRHNVRASRRLEVDTAYTLTSMVAGGIGWAVTTPLCLMQGGEFARLVTPVFLKPLDASRVMYVVARENEYSQMVEHIAVLARSVITASVLPALRAINTQLDKLVHLDEGNHHECQSPPREPT